MPYPSHRYVFISESKSLPESKSRSESKAYVRATANFQFLPNESFFRFSVDSQSQHIRVTYPCQELRVRSRRSLPSHAGPVSACVMKDAELEEL